MFSSVDQERLLDELDPISHDLGLKPSFSLDIGDGKDKSVMSVYDVETGEYTFSAEVVETSTDALKFLLGEYEHKTFRDLCDEAYRAGDHWALFALAMSKMGGFWGFNPQTFADLNYAQGLLLKLCRRKRRERVSKTRKTTYKTIRRDCAKRNRHK